MAGVKRKKTEKGYSYHEYVQKFRPKSLPKEEERPNKKPSDCLSKLALDDIVQEGAQDSSDSEDRK